MHETRCQATRLGVPMTDRHVDDKIFTSSNQVVPYILIVEDNEINQRIYELFINELGYKSFTVGRGIDALDAIQTVKFDAILLDIGLPDISGIDVCKKIRKGAHNPNIPIVLISAHAEANQVADLGANGFFEKPFSINTLRKVFHELGIGNR